MQIVIKQRYCSVVLFFLYICKKETMHLTDFNKELAKEFNISEREAKKILSYINKAMHQKLLLGTNISLRKIGTLILKIKHPKPYLNLQTGEMQMSKRAFALGLRVTRSMDQALRKKTVYGYSKSQQ